MKTKLLLIAISTTLFLNGCKKDVDFISESTNSPSVAFNYKGIKYNNRNEIKETNEQITFVVSENEVYVFDSHDEFEVWGRNSEYANEIIQLENKRKLALAYAQTHGTIEEFKQTGKLSQDFLDYYASLGTTQKSNKLDLFLTLNSEKKNKGQSFILFNEIPYVFLPFFDNKASSVSGGLVFFLTLFEDMFYGGKSIIVLINTSDLSLYGFNDKASSALALY